MTPPTKPYNSGALQPCSEEYPQKPLPHPPTLEERYAALQEEAKSLRRELVQLFRDHQDLQLRYEREKDLLDRIKRVSGIA